MKSVITIIAVILLAYPIMATDFGKGGGGSVITDLPDTQLRVHHQSNIYFSVTNFGMIGSQGGDFDDYEGVFQVAPGAEFPAGSAIEHLFQGSIWIGAVVDTFPPNNMFDTLVSVGNDGWWGTIYELYPTTDDYISMWRDSSVADEEIYAVFSDTCTGTFVNPDPNDQRPHIPLGIEVVRHSLGWTDPVAEDVFIMEHTFRNMYDRELQNVWIAYYYDGDVFHPSDGANGYQDDLTGFLPYGDHGIAWLADNDGEPFNGAFDSTSSTMVMGSFMLDCSEPNVDVNFNWWSSNVISDLDWGPQLASNYGGPFPGGGNGTPGGDKAKYKVMSNGEIDYDQIYCALDFSGQGWIAPAPNGNDVADGRDARYLISFGPFQFQPAEVETLVIAYIGGNDLHTDPSNYVNNLQGHTQDSASIANYYNGLDFNDLIAKADMAIQLYQQMTSIDDGSSSLPCEFSLRQNYPNPFNASTMIEFTLAKQQDVKLTVYDLLGREVRTLLDEPRLSGIHKVAFDASDLTSGVYFYRLRAGDRVETGRMTLLR